MREDERPPNPEMQREELVNLEKENARAIKFQESNIFQVRVLRRFSPCLALRRSRKKGEVESIPFEFDSMVSSDHQVKMFRDAAYVLSMRFKSGMPMAKSFTISFEFYGCM